MLSGDYLMRQVHQLAQVLARALMRRHSEQPDEALEAVASGWSHVPAFVDAQPASLPREALLAACSDPGGRLHPETALLVADLLALEGDIHADSGQHGVATDSRLRALWLYEAASRVPGAALPLDIFERIDRLAAGLEA